jgi:hypothetical protein
MNSEALVRYIPFCQHKVVDIGGRELNFLVEDIDVSVLRCLILLYLPYKIDPGDKRTFFLICTRLISCIAQGGFVEPLQLLVDLLKGGEGDTVPELPGEDRVVALYGGLGIGYRCTERLFLVCFVA